MAFASGIALAVPPEPNGQVVTQDIDILQPDSNDDPIELRRKSDRLGVLQVEVQRELRDLYDARRDLKDEFERLRSELQLRPDRGVEYLDGPDNVTNALDALDAFVTRSGTTTANLPPRGMLFLRPLISTLQDVKPVIQRALADDAKEEVAEWSRITLPPSFSAASFNEFRAKLVELAQTAACDNEINQFVTSVQDKGATAQAAAGELKDCANRAVTEIGQRNVNLRGWLDEQKDRVQKGLDEAEKKLRQREGQLHDAQASLERAVLKKGDLKEIIAKWTIPSFGLVVVALLVAPLARTREDIQVVYKNGLILELATIFVLVCAILILALSDKLEPNALGTLLAGISGYVLGRNSKGRGEGAKDSSHNPSSR